MKADILLEPKCQVRAKSLIHYSIPHPRPERTYRQFDAKTYSGKMTLHTAARIRKTIDLFVQISPKKVVWNDVSRCYQNFQLNFITLTISCPDIVPPDEGYKNLLAPFLRQVRTLGHVSYVWKGEYQKRGQPHWHLTTNCFVNWTWVRERWNNLQSKSGYLDAYRREHGHDHAPSTEVRAVRKLDRIDLYLAKYLSKSPGAKPWVGKVWGCSDNLRKGKQFSFTVEQNDDEPMAAGREIFQPKVIYNDHATIWAHDDPKKFLSPERQKEMDEHLAKIR